MTRVKVPEKDVIIIDLIMNAGETTVEDFQNFLEHASKQENTEKLEQCSHSLNIYEKRPKILQKMSAYQLSVSYLQIVLKSDYRHIF